ncbi:MAG: hypothetical protein ABIP94_05265 [Planctomycetota bacterium]
MVGAAALGEGFEGALLLSLFSFGHALEGFAMSRARKAIEALAELVPETALRVSADRARALPCCVQCPGFRGSRRHRLGVDRDLGQ